MLEVAVNDSVGSAVDKSEHRGRRVGRGVLGKRRTAEDEEIRQLPVLKIGRDDGVSGRISHDGAALDVRGVVMGGVVGAQALEWINLARAHGASNFNSFGGSEFSHLAFIVAPVER